MRFTQTRRTRVMRRFSHKEVSDFLGFSRKVTWEWLAHPLIQSRRENTAQGYSLDEIMLLRGLMQNRKQHQKRPTLHWRAPGDPLPVITFSSQKGGTAKSMSAASLAAYCTLTYGLRVGLIDADPQATSSLYFVDDTAEIAGLDVDTFTRFMGVPAPGQEPLRFPPKDLDRFWKTTPWPGLRIIPGGAPIQEADISMFLMARSADKSMRRVYRLLRDALDRWEAAHPPRTQTRDLVDHDGNFREDIFRDALTETLDLVIIDSAPALTLSQLNTVTAATTLVVPNTMRGFDLSTAQIYLSSLDDYLHFIGREPDPIVFPERPSYILPTIVSTTGDADIRQVGELYAHDPEIICPVFYARSEAVANAARDYQSIYEYVPPPGRRRSTRDFLANANAVNDALLTRAVPRLPSRGYANAFIARTWPDGMVPPWTETEEPGIRPETAEVTS